MTSNLVLINTFWYKYFILQGLSLTCYIYLRRTQVAVLQGCHADLMLADALVLKISQDAHK